MALKATIYKAILQIADMDRHYYADHTLTLARHPSETDERMMVRILAFALYAHSDLALTRGLSDVEEPDLWQKDLTGAIAHWIEIGQPDDTRIRKACARAERVTVLAFSSSTDIWWKNLETKVARQTKLCVQQVPATASQQLTQLTQRSMRLQITIQENQIWIGDEARTVPLELVMLKPAAN